MLGDLINIVKDLGKNGLILVVGAGGAILLAGYGAAWKAQSLGYETEFSDYGFLKKTSAPESDAAKNCRELRISYDAGRQALIEQMRTTTERKTSNNQGITNILREYPAARRHDEADSNTTVSNSASNIIRSAADDMRRDIEADESAERDLRASVAVEYNNLAKFCYTTTVSQR